MNFSSVIRSRISEPNEDSDMLSSFSSDEEEVVIDPSRVLVH
jgi:hypothetical protein